MFMYLWSRLRSNYGFKKNSSGVYSRYLKEARVELSTGGFIQIVFDAVPDTAYVRVHLGVPKHNHDLDETYKYVLQGRDYDMMKFICELKQAIGELEYEMRH